MFIERHPEERIDRYSGPYERWVFSEELGKPFAFPAIAEDTSGFYTAILEGTADLSAVTGIDARLPPLWNPLGHARSATPFAFHDAAGNDPRRRVQQDTEIARLLRKLSPGTEDALAEVNARFRLNFPIAPESWVLNYDVSLQAQDWVAPATRPSAIVAVIDDGIPFGHSAFLGSDGHTRISHCWLQSGRAETQRAVGVPFGREYTNGAIDALRAQAGADEALFYRKARAIDSGIDELGTMMRRLTTHGAHVMGLCAGNSWRLDEVPLGDDIQIIAVQLPNTIAWDTSGFGKEMYMLSALHYVFDRARAIAAHFRTGPGDPEELPLVVNFSYGWSAGRHDGRSPMEAAIQELLADRKSIQPATALTMPSGNNFADAMHGQITAADMSGDNYAFGWKVQPDDHTSSYLELWFPEDFHPVGYSLHVTPPPGSALGAGNEIEVSPDPQLESANGSLSDGDPRRFVEMEIDGRNVGQLSADFHRSSRWRVMVALIPTVYTRGQDRRAPAGLWRLELRRNGAAALGADQVVNVWVQRDDDPSDLKSLGRQSRLVDLTGPAPQLPPLQQYDDALGFVRGYGAMNAVCSSPDTTRVGGYEHVSRRPVAYGGAQGVRRTSTGDAARWGSDVTVTAMAGQSRGLPWSSSTGALSGGTSRLLGTSTATPAVARRMVANAAAGLDFFDGFEAAPPLAPSEPDTQVTREKHRARMGELLAPPIMRFPV